MTTTTKWTWKRAEARRFVYETTAVAGGNISYNYPEIIDYLRMLDNQEEKQVLLEDAINYLTSEGDERFKAEHKLYFYFLRLGYVRNDVQGHGLELICREIKELCA